MHEVVVDEEVNFGRDIAGGDNFWSELCVTQPWCGQTQLNHGIALFCSKNSEPSPMLSARAVCMLSQSPGRALCARRPERFTLDHKFADRRFKIERRDGGSRTGTAFRNIKLIAVRQRPTERFP